ncbi:putative transcriptional regulator [Methylosinus sp. sav-2]|uniref:CopG family ribbon-helix-helix protein n=1 Tax=Methylosinus sp. sav-2 TaxID=2485168 RepID=UPI0005646FCE|nr:CopG family ribbon-helix-helix protein [Methylosinus sp. sav-2]TDX64303.1 putative transcriptional regulator [Methylosinus sp. sav-2]
MKTQNEARASETFTVRVDAQTKARLEKLAESTGRSRSFLAAEAITQFLDANEWQVEGIRDAIRAIDAGEAIAHQDVRKWVESWDTPDETPAP